MTAESTLQRPGQAAHDAGARASDRRFLVRPAGPADVPSLEEIERDAFPEQWPPTRFAPEIRKTDVIYLIAAAPATPGPGSEARPPNGSSGATTSPVPAAGRLPAALGNLLRLRVPWRHAGGPGAQLPPSYVAGFAGMWFVVDEAHVISIGVRRLERRRGVGELLLLGAFDAARRRQMNVLTLEVRRSNSGAQALYAKYGFRQAGLRKRYYVDNGEDAIIMTTPPITTPEFAERLQRLAREHAERWGRGEPQPR